MRTLKGGLVCFAVAVVEASFAPIRVANIPIAPNGIRLPWGPITVTVHLTVTSVPGRA
jgi:hypothetical protein